MAQHNRRTFLKTVATAASVGASMTALPPVIRKALAVTALRRTGTIRDVEHIVVLTQENRSFDHYFGTYRGVRGFGDRFPIPTPGRRSEKSNVWAQASEQGVLHPFRLDTEASLSLLRVSGTPHTFDDAQAAWAHGKLHEWPKFKRAHSLGYFSQEDIPFQFALAEAFTLCDAYHCSFHGGTNPNRNFLFTGTNDPSGRGGGPVVNNDYDVLDHDPRGGYTFMTYAERLEQAGITWRIYQDMNDNFTDNPLVGFRSFRDAHARKRGSVDALRVRGLSSYSLDDLRNDVLSDSLPQVSWVVATAEGSEHPGPSSPAQGADYTSEVLDALIANSEVWAKTVLFVNFDENDGFFDHVPPPAVPSYEGKEHGSESAFLAGSSTVDTRGEYHNPSGRAGARGELPRPYGLGPRVPMYVISPWSKGGFVNSEVLDHTSVIRFMERRFGVFEPNISPWRRAVCGDLTSAFNFAVEAMDDRRYELPETRSRAAQARALHDTHTPEPPTQGGLPAQELGYRPSRALPYELHVHARVRPDAGRIDLQFKNTGRAGAVFHVYDMHRLGGVPRRYTVEAGKELWGAWEVLSTQHSYDLWVLGPNGFHRRFSGIVPAERGRETADPEISVGYEVEGGVGHVFVRLINGGGSPCTLVAHANAYIPGGEWQFVVPPYGATEQRWDLAHCAHWYDFTVSGRGSNGFLRRFAGRVETGRDSFSDPAMGGMALDPHMTA